MYDRESLCGIIYNSNDKIVDCRSYLREIFYLLKILDKFPGSDRIKLNIPCFVSYIVLILIVIISIILFSCPEMPCEPVRLPFSRHGGITIDTYNMKVPYILAFLMLFTQFDITFISLLIKLFKANNETETKGSKIGGIILTLGFLFVTGYLIYALFQ